jgi:hypothetical protein
MSASANNWKYLARRPKSAYKQLFIKGTKFTARQLYGQHVNEEEPRTAEELALDYNVPLEAVKEAIVYCQTDPPEIREDWEREEDSFWARARTDPDFCRANNLPFPPVEPAPRQ